MVWGKKVFLFVYLNIKTLHPYMGITKVINNSASSEHSAVQLNSAEAL